MKLTFKKWRTQFLMVIVLVIFFALQYLGLRDQFQSFHFGDETEHLSISWQMIQSHRQLYTDLSTNHQPLPILMATVFNQIIGFENLFMYIQRIRQLMLAVSFIFGLALTVYFGWVGLVTVVLLETSRFYFLGYHVLGESLVVYPVIFVMLSLIKMYFEKYIPGLFTTILLGVCWWWIGFNLLPLAIFLVISFLLFVFKFPQKALMALGVSLTLSLGLFLYIDIAAWYRETVFNVLEYFIPSDNNLPNGIGKLVLLAFPSLSWLNLQTWLGKFVSGLWVLVVLNGYRLIKRKTNIFTPKNTLVALSFYLVITALNTRTISYEHLFFGGFHLFPFVAGLISLASYSLIRVLRDKKSGIGLQAVIISAMVVVLIGTTIWWREDKNALDTFYIQYGDTESVGRALSAVKKPTDRLLVGELNGFVYQVSGIPMAGRQNAYLPWAYQSPLLRQEFFNLMANNPPEFIIFPETFNPYWTSLKVILDKDYARIKRPNNSNSDLYVLSNRLESFSQEDITALSDLSYYLPAD